MTRDGLPFDPDVETDATGRQPADRFALVVLGVVALGGALGAVARYGVAQAVHASAGGFPWATFLTNVSGSLAIGVVVVTVVERYPRARLVRPFVATGFLGGYTTFSTFAVEGDLLVRNGHVPLAVVYWILSTITALTAAFVGMVATRRWLAR